MRRLGLAVLLFFAACGSSQPSSSSSGVDKSKTIAAIDDTEKGQICDWANGLLGGYGHPITCSGQTVDTTDASQADCVQDFPACDATVGAYESCISMLAANECDEAGAAAALASAPCQASAACF